LNAAAALRSVGALDPAPPETPAEEAPVDDTDDADDADEPDVFDNGTATDGASGGLTLGAVGARC
jgi:hypothetical protein